MVAEEKAAEKATALRLHPFLTAVITRHYQKQLEEAFILAEVARRVQNGGGGMASGSQRRKQEITSSITH